MPLNPNISRIRELISSLELCHHKVDRWIYNIIEAIGKGDTQKGLGTRSPDQEHSVERVWQEACAALSAWCAGGPSSMLNMSVDNTPASQILACMGDRTPLKEWQGQRVVEKIRSVIRWPHSSDDPSAQYMWILLGGENYKAVYRDECPDRYKEHEDFWNKTIRTIIHDTVNGHETELSLGLAIDMLWPCHWRFTTNLQIVLEAIGGRLNPEAPFAACGRNIKLLPQREQMEAISNSLNAFCVDSQTNTEVDRSILTLLGEPTEEKKWLAASLDKTIRLQLYPPADMLVLSALDGPAWIKE